MSGQNFREKILSYVLVFVLLFRVLYKLEVTEISRSYLMSNDPIVVTQRQNSTTSKKVIQVEPMTNSTSQKAQTVVRSVDYHKIPGTFSTVDTFFIFGRT